MDSELVLTAPDTANSLADRAYRASREQVSIGGPAAGERQLIGSVNSSRPRPGDREPSIQ
jgi:hypothetical protein